MIGLMLFYTICFVVGIACIAVGIVAIALLLWLIWGLAGVVMKGDDER